MDKKEKFSLVVIGSGLAGMSAAIEAREQGIDVAVVIQYGFSTEKSYAFIPWDKLFYFQTGSAAFLYEIVDAD